MTSTTTRPAPAPSPEVTGDVALACRILARAGLASGALGHVSARTADGRVLVRCRGPEETGLLFTDPAAIQDAAAPADGYAAPYELSIHTELYRARPDIGSVVHVHAPAAVLASLAGLELRPVFGAYDIPAARLALAGVPVYDRAVLISRPDLGAELVGAMAGKDVCLLRGHGIVTVGSSVQAATARALELERLAETTVSLARLGATAALLTDADRQELPDLGPAFDDGLVWRHHERLDLVHTARPPRDGRTASWAS